MMGALDGVLHSALGIGTLAVVLILAIGMFLNSSVMAPPSEYLGLFGGVYAASHSPRILVLLVVVLTLANFLGTAPWYFLGRRRRLANKPFLSDKWIARLPAVIRRLYVAQLRGILGAFERDNEILVLVLRLMPIIRSIVSYPAGFARMPLGPFLLLSIVGISMWVGVWSVLGYVIGKVLYSYSFPIGLLLGAIVVAIYWMLRTPIAEEDRQ